MRDMYNLHLNLSNLHLNNSTNTQRNIFTKNDDMFFYINNWCIYNYHCTELKNLILVTKDKITAIITS